VGVAALAGLAVAAAGAALAWRGLGGWCKLYEALGIDTAGAGRTVGNLGVKIDRDVVVAAPPSGSIASGATSRTCRGSCRSSSGSRS
jgi:hypothetical protein